MNYEPISSVPTGSHEVNESKPSKLSPLLTEIHWCEEKYESISKTPLNDPHFQKAQKIAQGRVKPIPVRKRHAADDDQIWSMWRGGMTYSEIANSLKISYATVSTHIGNRRAGEPTTSRRFVDHAEVVRLYRIFRDEKRVAIELGFTKQGIHRHIQKAIEDGEIVEACDENN